MIEKKKEWPCQSNRGQHDDHWEMIMRYEVLRCTNGIIRIDLVNINVHFDILKVIKAIVKPMVIVSVYPLQ